MRACYADYLFLLIYADAFIDADADAAALMLPLPPFSSDAAADAEAMIFITPLIFRLYALMIIYC